MTTRSSSGPTGADSSTGKEVSRFKDRGRVRVDGKPSRLLFQYELPHDWALVP